MTDEGGTRETRRQRLRRELTAEVVATARAQLESGGPAGVSWRGIARAVGVNPASLYTYFDSLEDVFTAVILDSFERLGRTMQDTAQGAAAEPPLRRLRILALGYRQWALDHPAEFNLIFTDQIPGYAAPPEGPTVAAQVSIFEPFATALGELTGAPDTAGSSLPTEMAGPSGFVGLWGTMHGLTMLEINHHLPFIDDHTKVFVDAMEHALSGWTR